MSGFSAAQADVARALFALPEATGYALAGGSALLVLGAIDRPTRDVDAFIGAKPENPPGDVGPLAVALRPRLEVEGWAVTIDRQVVTFARLVARRAGEVVEVDLAVDSPPLFPVEIVEGLPVLSGRDLAARKVLAILDRAEGRDFTDLRALAERYTQAACIDWAQALDAGVRLDDIARSFTKLDRLAEADLPCPAGEAPALREWFEQWSTSLAAER